MAASRPTLAHSQGDSLTNRMFITTFELFQHKGHRELCDDVEFLSPAERQVGFES